MKTSIVLLALIALFLLTSAAVAQPGSYDLSWWTVDSGGGPRSGGNYALLGSVGQIDAEMLSGSGYTLFGGFFGVGTVTQRHIYLPVVLRQS